MLDTVQGITPDSIIYKEIRISLSIKRNFLTLLILRCLQSLNLESMNFGFFKKNSVSQMEIIDGMVHAEHTMLDKYSGLKVGKTVHILNVPILLNGKEETIHTVRAGDDQKEDLVLIHGYLVGLASFFKMLKDLSQRYRVWLIDLVGMGLSSSLSSRVNQQKKL